MTYDNHFTIAVIHARILEHEDLALRWRALLRQLDLPEAPARGQAIARNTDALPRHCGELSKDG